MTMELMEQYNMIESLVEQYSSADANEIDGAKRLTRWRNNGTVMKIHQQVSKIRSVAG